MEKNPPSLQEMQVRLLYQEDPLEEGMANPLQYSCLRRELPWTEEPGELQSVGSQTYRQQLSN